MAVHIKPISDTEISVNNKTVILDTNNNWIATIELTVNEVRAFQNYKINYLDNSKSPAITLDL